MAAALKTKNFATEKKDLTEAAEGRGVGTNVYCTLCTRTVDAIVTVVTNTIGKRRLGVKPGQKCSRCGGSLDAAYVLGNLS